MGSDATTIARAKVAKPRRGFYLTDPAFKWVLLLPSVIVVVGLLVFPMGMTLYASFTDWHLYAHGRAVEFAGLANWGKLLQDDFFRITTRNTLVFVLVSVPAECVLGTIVALALNNCSRGRKFFRVFFLMPLMISPVAVSVVIGRMVFSESMGPLNDLLWRAGLPQVSWITDPFWAMVTVLMVDIWQQSAFMILMLTAGLQSLPQEPYEAAFVDGASQWQSFRHITLPLLAPVGVTALLIRGLDAFKVVDIIRVVTGGGPGQATESITLAVYDLGVKGGDIAYGSAAAYGLLIIMAIAAALLVLATRRWVEAAS